MKLASIDVGTNSVRLLIADYSGFNLKPLVRKAEITRLGKNLVKTGEISQKSAFRTNKVLSTYLNLIKKWSVAKYRAIGTSALRQAKNRDWFLSYIYQNLGIEIEVVTGYQEARFSFSGAIKDLDIESFEDVLVVDIGGGSTEFILGNCNLEIVLIRSIDIGCVNLTEKFIESDPPKEEELSNMHGFIRDRLKRVVEEIKKQRYLSIVGVAGTITTLCSIDLGLKKYDMEKIHHHILKIENICRIYDSLCNVDFGKRKKIVGLELKRADIIIAGTAILLEVMKLLGKNVIVVSERDILDGIVYSLVDFC